VKDYLGIEGTDADSLISELISEKTAFITNYCQRKFEQDEFTEYFDGGVQRILLKNYPVKEITSVSIDSDRIFYSGTETEDYAIDLESGILTFDREIGKGAGVIEVVYIGGFESVPQDIGLACKKLVASEYLISRTQVNTREGLETMRERVKILNEQAKETLDRYKRIHG
jgi:hypothetical protein